MDFTFLKRDLFEGALEAEFPSDWIDTSITSSLDDNQVTLTDPSHHFSASLEICERAEISDEQAVCYFFKEKARQNNATSKPHNSVISSKELDQSAMPYMR
jgi:hypothetical protein